MIKKTITSVIDFETQEKDTRDYYFNLTKAEALELELMEQLQSVGKSNNPQAIVPVFKKIIHYAYGVKLPTGAFSKDSTRTADFLASDAYSELFLQLLEGGAPAFNEFIDSILSFSVDEMKDVKVGDVDGPARPAPQDYKKSAREIAAEAVTVKATEKVDLPIAQDHAEDPEYAEYLAFKRAKAERLAERRDAERETLAHETEDLSEPTPAWENDTITIEESPIQHHNAFEKRETHVEPQALRRDLRDQA